MEQRILKQEMYEKTKKGVSMFGGDLVEVIGERTVELQNNVIVEQFLYLIKNIEPENALTFVGLKANVIILD